MSDEDELPSIRVPCPSGHRLHFSWGIGSCFRVVGVCDPNFADAGPAPESHTISTVIWDSAPRSHEALAHSIAPTFCELQQSKLKGPTGSESLQCILDYSRKVREKLHGGARSLDNDDELQLSVEHALWQLLDVFCIDAARSEGFIAEDMVRWLSDNRMLVGHLLSPLSLEGRLHALLALSRPEANEDYWPCLRNLVAVGWLPEALELLGAHDVVRSQGTAAMQQPGLAHQYEVLDALFILIRSMPRFRLAGGGDVAAGGRAFDNMPEFLSYHQKWQHNCASLPSVYVDLFDACRRVSTATADGVQSVLEVLGGDEAALVDNTTSWPELLAGQLMHLVPQLRARHHMAPLLSRCVAAKPYDQRDAIASLLHNLMLALSDMELQHVVELLAGSGVASTWMLAHVMELLRTYPGAGAVLELPLTLFGGDQVEYWRLSLAESLLSQPSRWQLAVQYLSWCQTHGAAAAELLLEVLPVTSSSDERQLLKARRVASRHGLPAATAALSRRAGVCAWYEGRLGAALCHLADARDDQRLGVVLGPVEEQVQALLLSNIGQYATSGLPDLPGAHELRVLLAASCPSASTGSDVVDGGKTQAQPSQQQPPRRPTGGTGGQVAWLLNFLQLQYAGNRVAGTQGPEQRAAFASYRSALMALVTGGTVPRHMCGPLLFSAVPFLESSSSHAVFGMHDMQALQTWMTACEQTGLDHGTPLTSVSALHPRHIKDVRLALARGIACAHVCENTVVG